MFSIVVKTQFSAVHSWPECPIANVKYLQHPHRHVFHVKLKRKVHHDDRDVEFIDFKEQVDEYLRVNYEYTDMGKKSCEMLAKELADTFGCYYVRVMEDNENGAEYKTETM